MDERAAYLVLLLLALGAHAAVSLLSASLHSLSRAAMRERADDGDEQAQRYLALTDDKLTLGLTVSLAHVLTRIATAVILLLLLAALADGVSPALAIVSVALGACLTLVLGDLLPEALGAAHAETLLPLSIAPMRLLVLLMSPMAALALLLSRLLSRLAGGEPLAKLVTEEEIMSVVQASHSGGVLEAEEKDMIVSVLRLDESSAREVMTPRIDIVALAVDDSVMEALAAFVDSGFSRIPVYQDSIDNVIGLLYAKDILGLVKNGADLRAQSIRDLARPATFAQETQRADALLKELQEKNVHLAIVVDEYGGTAGLVTIEDLIEEIIGDIRDEHDFAEEADFVALGDGAYLIEGSMDLDDLNALLDCAIDTAAADTLGGYIYLCLGRVPRANETIESEFLRMTVRSIEGHRIRKVEACKIEPAQAAERAPKSAAYSTPSQAK